MRGFCFLFFFPMSVYREEAGSAGDGGVALLCFLRASSEFSVVDCQS